MSARPFLEPETPAAEASPGPIRAFFVVLNRGSGKQQAVEEELREVFEQAGRRVEFVAIEPGQVAAACQKAARMAKDAGGALVAVGGDGTLNAATQAALLHDVPFGAIAGGTFNLFARDHGLSLEPLEAARDLLDAVVEPVQVGLLNERVFIVNASIGLYPKVFEDREVMKQKLGRARWVAAVAGLKTLLDWKRHLDVELDLDGRIMRVRTATLFVGNNRLQLQQAGVDDALTEQVGRGRLVVMVARPQGKWAKLRWAARALVGQLADSPEVDVHPLRSLTVSAPRQRGTLHAATDGETIHLTPPLRFAVSPKALRLLVPVRRPDEA